MTADGAHAAFQFTKHARERTLRQFRRALVPRPEGDDRRKKCLTRRAGMLIATRALLVTRHEDSMCRESNRRNHSC
jgi:hypothetical protein